jgi:hypothetical protein
MSTGTPPLATPWHRCNYNRVIIHDRLVLRKGENPNIGISNAPYRGRSVTLGATDPFEGPGFEQSQGAEEGTRGSSRQTSRGVSATDPLTPDRGT